MNECSRECFLTGALMMMMISRENEVLERTQATKKKNKRKTTK